jgi:hypothetical protein
MCGLEQPDKIEEQVFKTNRTVTVGTNPRLAGERISAAYFSAFIPK